MDRRRFIRSSLSAAGLAAIPNFPALAVSLVHKPTQVPGDIEVVTGDGREVTLARAAVQELSDALRGKLLLRGSEGYDDARVLFVPSYDKYPALVVQPTFCHSCRRTAGGSTPTTRERVVLGALASLGLIALLAVTVNVTFAP